MNFKDIHIGTLINQRIAECGMGMPRICKFFKCSQEEIIKMYEAKNLDSDTILRWSKLLEYDFFRIYSQHLILYAPPSAAEPNTERSMKKNTLPRFRKNIYTMEMIKFIMEMIEKKQKTKAQVIDEYKIPKTTLYKWISKYKR